MKLKSLPAIFAFSLLIAGPTAASPHRVIDVNQKVVGPGVFFCVKGAVGTLRGVVDTNLDKALLGQSAMQLEGIEEVRNYLQVRN